MILRDIALRMSFKTIVTLLMLWPADGVVAQTSSSPSGTMFQFQVQGDASRSSGLKDKEKLAAQDDVKSAAPQSKASSIPSSQGTFISATTGRRKQATEPPVSKDQQVRPK
jgi:hypothetical protein